MEINKENSKKVFLFFVGFIFLFLFWGKNFWIQWKPLGIPVTVTITPQGDVNIEYSGEVQTPIGAFGVGTDIDISAIQEKYGGVVLIIRVDKEVSVYELDENEEFRVVFDDRNTLYKKITLEHQVNGDIILELESLRGAGAIVNTPIIITSAPIVVTSTPAISTKTATPENSLKNYVTISCEEDITQAALRKSPGYSTKDDNIDIIYKIDCGQRLELLGLNQKADGLTWWQVSWNGYTGWMADYTGSGRTILLFE